MIHRHVVAKFTNKLTVAKLLLFYYGASIFKSVGISDSFVTQIILGAVNFRLHIRRIICSWKRQVIYRLMTKTLADMFL